MKESFQNLLVSGFMSLRKMRRCQCPSYKDNEKIIPVYIKHCLAVLLKTLACFENDL